MTEILCERYRCKMDSKWCVTRHRLAVSGNRQNLGLRPGVPYDPGCATCEQGIFIAKGVGLETKIEKQTTKICRICEIELPLSSFAKHSQCRLGVENTCRACKKRKPSATKPSPNRMPVVIHTGNQPDTAAHKIDSGNVIMLNFKQMDGLYEKIKKIADDEFRTIENQIMYLLSKHIGKHAEQTQ